MKRKDHNPRSHEPSESSEPMAASAPAEASAPADASATRDEVDKLRAERDDLLARLQRVSADYMNYQKRVQRDIAEGREFANAELIKGLLGVLDDMERGLNAARANHNADDPLLMGMELVHRNALETLTRFGLSAIESVGLAFDPDKHSAVLQEPSGQHPPMTVLRELQKGYALKGRTLRPAMVAVSKAPQEEPPGPPREPQELTGE